MPNNHIKSAISEIFHKIREFTDLTIGKDIHFSTIEDQRRLSWLKESEPLCALLQNKLSEPFTTGLRLKELWQSLYNVPPTT
jgi:hypothetical protein